MNNIEFIQFIDVAIHDEMLLGPNKNENRLIGLRNIKSDFNYIASTNNKLSTSDNTAATYVIAAAVSTFLAFGSSSLSSMPSLSRVAIALLLAFSSVGRVII